MLKASLTFATAFLLAIALAITSHAADKKTLTVTAVTHDSRVNERTSYHTKPGQSTTDCSGTGTNYGDDTIRIRMDCDTKTTPPTTSSITTRTTDVTEKVMDSEGMVYTIVCTDRPNILGAAIVGAAQGGGGGGNTTLHGSGKCVPLIDGDRFEAEIKDTTMWVHARRGGNQGKAIKIKYKILDIRKMEPPAVDPNCRGDEQDTAELWKLGRSLDFSDDLISSGIKTMGVCSALFYTRRAYADKMGTSQCVGDKWDNDRALSLGRSLGEKENEINDAIKQLGVCKVLSYFRQEQAERKARASDPLRAVPPPDIFAQQTAAQPPSLPQSQPPAPSPSAPAPQEKSANQSATNDSGSPRVGGGHSIKEVSNNGAIVTLEDGSLWEISTVDRVDTALWLPATNITVLKSQSPVGDYKYTLINKDDGEKAAAKYLGKE